MENLIIEKTKYTPLINFNAQNGILELVGKSYPEDTFEFYKPMMDWLEKYFSEKGEATLNIEMIYFNSSSSKLFFDLFDHFEELSNDGKNINVNWIYDEDNESGLEAGEDFQEEFEKLKFNLVIK